MDREELRVRLATGAVIRQRSSSLGALVRGWRFDSARVLSDPEAAETAARLLGTIVSEFRAACVIGIADGATPLVHSMAANAMLARCVPIVATIDLERRANPLIAIVGPSARTNWRNLRAVLVDDTINSGWTAQRAIRTAKSAGIDVVAVACLLRYSVRRPLLLYRWRGSIRAIFVLRDLRLQRFC